MSSSNPSPIRVRLEIEVPTSGDSKLHMLFGTSVPAAGQTVLVKPSGSSGLGSICAQVGGYSTAPAAVKGYVWPERFYPGGSPPLKPEAVAATPSVDRLTWSWTDANMVPAADHSASSPFPGDVLAVWRLDNHASDYVFDGAVRFFGQTGTLGPCGSGSGSGSNGSRIAYQGGLFPVFWHLEVVEFPGALAMFNAMWGLRQNPTTRKPTWDNRADGKTAVRVQLTEGARGGWDLTFTLGELHVDYSAPRTGHVFGPIRFEGRKETVKPLGKVALPAIVVSPA